MNEIFVNIKNENAWIKEQFNNEEIVSIEDIFTVIEDLIFENETLKNEFNNFKKDVEDNYRPIPINEQYEIYDSDFI